MRMIRTSLLLALAAALVPGVALAGGDRDTHRGEGGPSAGHVGSPSQTAPHQVVYILRGTITALTGTPTPTGFTMDVTKANDAGAKALGGPTATGGPVNPSVVQNVLIDPGTRVFRTARGHKSHHSSGKGKGSRVSTDPASLRVGDEVKVLWRAAPGLTGATLATTVARQVIAKGALPPKPAKFIVRAYVVSLPDPGALPTTFLVDPFKVNGNAARALNPLDPTITGGSYDLAGTIPVIIGPWTKVNVAGQGRWGHWGHHRVGRGLAEKLARVKVGDRVDVQWTAPAGSAFWTQAARKVEFKSAGKGHK